MIKTPILCIVCNNNITPGDRYQMIAIEVPYINLFLHKNCYQEVSSNLLEFLIENLEKYMKMTRK